MTDDNKLYDELSEAVSQLYEAVSQVVSAVVPLLHKILYEISTTLSKIPFVYDPDYWEKTLYLTTHYPKIWHLAHYARKTKTRKKNTRRLEKYWRRYHGDNKIC